MKERLYVGLDLGTSHIRIAVGQLGMAIDKRPTLNHLGAVAVPSQGIAKGNVTSLDDAVTAISACLEHAERLIGLPISEATVGIGGTGISSQRTKGIVGVSRPEGDIRAEDVERALEAAKACVNPANHEILHVLPGSFTVDGQMGIKDPIGMQGIRLEVDTQIVQGLSSQIRNLTNAVFRTGLDVTELIYAPLAVAEATTVSRQRELGVCVLSIGAATTGMAVFEDGELLHATTLPIGADHITSDIAIGLRVSLDAAERIKCNYGRADADALPKRGEEIDLMDYGTEQSEIVPVKYIAEIIQARVEELYDRVEAELRRIDRSGLLPAGVTLSGGGSKLPGMVEIGKRVLRLPCSLGRISLSSPMPEVIEDSSFSTAIGLVMWAFENEWKVEKSSARTIGLRTRSRRGAALLDKFKKPFKKLFQSLIP